MFQISALYCSLDPKEINEIIREKLDLLGIKECEDEESEEQDSSDDDDDGYDWEEPISGSKSKSGLSSQHSHINQQKASEKITKYQSADKLFNKVAGKINIDAYEVPGGNLLKDVSSGRFISTYH